MKLKKDKVVSKDKKNIGQIVLSILVVLLAISTYVLLIDNYLERNICTKRGVFVWVILGLAGIVAMILYAIANPDKRIKWKYHGCKWISFFINPLFYFFIEEFIWNEAWSDIAVKYWIINYLVILLIQLIMVLLIRRTAVVYAFLAVAFWFYGIANYYLVLYKGRPLLPQDILAINTARAVWGEYEYALTNSMLIGTLLLFGLCIGLLYIDLNVSEFFEKKKRFVKSVGLILATVMLYVIINLPVMQILGVNVSAWSQIEGFMLNGSPASYIYMLEKQNIKQPEGYSASIIKKELSQYMRDDSTAYENEKPSVIVIMNESMADLGVLGEFESEEYLSGVLNLSECIQKGYVYTSVYGGTTCNSEFEFLTGSSMANFETAIAPYANIDLKNTFDLVEEFNAMGYETVAFHPYTRENWNRDKVYEKFGFDKYLAIDELNGIEYLRWCASDQYDYKIVRELFEKKTAPLFLFNVTMQNHGGYLEDIQQEIPLLQGGAEVQKYRDVQNYLTLVRESDKAIIELLDYFSNQEEPVIVCLFGDHQPALDEEFVSTVLGDRETIEDKVKQYMTPYLIWSNFDTGQETVVQDMSLNYLGANLLKCAGIKRDYTEYLLDLYEEIPVVQLCGYQTADGVWHEWKEKNEKLDLYKQMQYYQLFKRKDKK